MGNEQTKKSIIHNIQFGGFDTNERDVRTKQRNPSEKDYPTRIVEGPSKKRKRKKCGK